MNRIVNIINIALIGLVLFIFSGACLAQDETLNLTTYYPAPFGVYRQLILYPEVADSTKKAGENCADEGLMYYDSDDNQVLYCYDSDPAITDLIWKKLGGGGADYWTFNDSTTPDSLYPSDLIQDPQEYWNVGIGTATPRSKLEVQDGAVLFTGTYTGSSGTTPIETAGTRFIWIPERASFRVGSAASGLWDDANIGNYSFATPSGCVADGTWSTCIGYSDDSTEGAQGDYSVAIGQARATGTYSVAIGSASAETHSSTAIGGGGDDCWNDVSGRYRTRTSREGYLVDGDYRNYSTALGFNTLANGWASVAAGDDSATFGAYSIALGRRAEAMFYKSAVVGLDNHSENCSYIPYCRTDATGQFKICGDLNVTGTVTVGDAYLYPGCSYGTLTVDILNGASKFKIPHPDPSKPEGTYLKHAAIESPTAGDNIYRWTIEVINGEAEIKLPDYYKFLNKDDMVLVFPKKHFGRAYGKVDGEQERLTIYANSDGKYNVLLIGTRKDEHATKYWQGPEVYIEPAG